MKKRIGIYKPLEGENRERGDKKWRHRIMEQKREILQRRF